MLHGITKLGIRRKQQAPWLLVLVISTLSLGNAGWLWAQAAPPVLKKVPGQVPQPRGGLELNVDKFHFAQVEWATPLRHEDNNRSEFEAYNEILSHARQFPTEELLAAGRRDLTVLDLLHRHVGRDYQYKLITLEGRMLRGRMLEPNKPLAAAGVTQLFECWVYPLNRTEPVAFVGTAWPLDLAPSLLYEPGKRVTVAGYYFKPLAYESGAPHPTKPNQRKIEVAPLLLGHGFTWRDEPPVDTAQPWREGFFPGLTVLVGLILLTVFGLTWFFRRGDRPIRERLAAQRDQNPFQAG